MMSIYPIMKKISELFQPGATWQLDKEDDNIAYYRHHNGDMSRVRFYLRDIQQTLTVASELQTLPAFTYHQAESVKKPWWKTFS